MNESGPYLRSIIHPQDKKTLDILTRDKHWDSAQLRNVLVSLAKLPTGNAIPAENAPESIHLQAWRPFIDDLMKRTVANGREHSRVVLADTGTGKIVMSGKIAVGSEDSTALLTDKQPGRRFKQIAVGSIHTHPPASSMQIAKGNMSQHGLSGQDYRVLIGDLDQQLMMIAYGSANSMFALKTSATPNGIATKSLDARITECERDYLSRNGRPYMQQVADFNKAICTEFGLCLYMATQQTRDLFERIPVVD
jgi:hypothetical protein